MGFEFLGIIMATSAIGWGLIIYLKGKRSRAAYAPVDLLSPPAEPELAADKWKRESPWPEVAKANGWTCVDDRPLNAAAAFRLSGTVDGQDFEAVSSLHFGLASLLPERLRVRSRTRKPPEDLVFRGSTLYWDREWARLSPDQRWLPGQGETQALEWNNSWLELKLAAPTDPETCVQQAMALFEELRRAQFPCWFEPREGWVLQTDSTGQWPRLRRQVDGRLVSASLERVQGVSRTRIMAPLPPSNTRFSLMHPDFQRGPKISTRHPIADSLLHATGDGEALHRLFEDPTAFSAIMAIVHGYPGSRLTHERIELIAPKDLGEGLLAAMEMVVQAAQAISTDSASKSTGT